MHNIEISISGDEWLSEDIEDEYSECWPMDWLPEDCPGIRVIGCDYESTLSKWMTTIGCSCDKGVLGYGEQIEMRSKEFLNNLAAAGVGQNRPVVFIGHSMGGLITKSIIVQALASNDPKIRAVGENVKGIFFLGTPHRGSPVAKLKQHTQYLLSPTIEVVELTENAKHLLTLHDKFIEIARNQLKNINIVSFIEKLPTDIGIPLKVSYKLVTEDSAFLEIGESFTLNEDHLGISKPVYRQSFLYRKILKMLNDVIDHTCSETQ